MTREELGLFIGKGALAGALGGIGWLVAIGIYLEASHKMHPYFYTGFIPMSLALGLLGCLIGSSLGGLLCVISYLRKKNIGIFSRAILGGLLSSLIVYLLFLASESSEPIEMLPIFGIGSFIGLPAAIMAGLTRSHKKKTEELGKISEN